MAKEKYSLLIVTIQKNNNIRYSTGKIPLKEKKIKNDIKK